MSKRETDEWPWDNNGFSLEDRDVLVGTLELNRGARHFFPEVRRLLKAYDKLLGKNARLKAQAKMRST